MTFAELLSMLDANEIKITLEKGELKIQGPRQNITSELKSFLKEYKPLLIEHLTSQPNEQNCGSPAWKPLELAPPMDTTSKQEKYHDYVLSDGSTLKLAEEEFSNVVDIFRMLLQQNTPAAINPRAS